MTAGGLNPEKAFGHREHRDHRESGVGRDGQGWDFFPTRKTQKGATESLFTYWVSPLKAEEPFHSLRSLCSLCSLWLEL